MRMFKNELSVLKSLVSLFALLCVLSPPAGAVSEYKLGPGDVVKVTVYEYPDLTTETQVTETGNITFPLLGEVAIGGLGKTAAEAKLAGLLKSGGFVKQPQVNLSISQYRSQQVAVMGQVNKAGKYALDAPSSSVTDLLSLAGGVTPDAADTITVIKNQRGSSTKVDVDLLKLFQAGDMKQNIEVDNGDVIYVPRAPVFYIYGEVQKPGTYRLEHNMTIIQALSLGGGLTPRGTDRHIKVHRRGSNGQRQTLEVALTDLLQPDDVVYIKESLF